MFGLKIRAGTHLKSGRLEREWESERGHIQEVKYWWKNEVGAKNDASESIVTRDRGEKDDIVGINLPKEAKDLYSKN